MFSKIQEGSFQDAAIGALLVLMNIGMVYVLGRLIIG